MAVTGKVIGEVLRGKAEIPGVVHGKDGESAYEIAVKNGFDGTEEEWLASLKGEGIPPITAEDKDKVLTANEDGTAEWKEPTGGAANIIFANSVGELPDPATVPENTVGLVPSEDDGEGGDTTELEQRVAEIERDHADNTGFVMHMTGLAKNPENDGKVYGIKDEQIVVMDLPSEEENPVKTVNGETPDENGNVQVEVGAKSWNDLADKPFGEEVEHLGDTLTWDGTPTDVFVKLNFEGELFYYKVCDSTPSVEELNKGTITMVYYDGEEQQKSLEDSVYHDYENLITANLDVLVALKDGAEAEGIIFPKKGIYLPSQNTIYCKSLHIPGYDFVNADLKKLDKKYLPDEALTTDDVDAVVEQAVSESKEYTDSQRIAYVGLEEKLVRDGDYTYDGDTKIWESIIPFGLVEGETYTVTTESGTYTAVCENKRITTSNGKFTYDEIGGYGNASLTKDGDYFKIEAPVIHTIDPKFLPDILPPATEADNGKVLTAKEDGTTEWKELTVPANIVIFNSLDDVPDDLPEGTIVLVPSEE